jgi:hypothetical protein
MNWQALTVVGSNRYVRSLSIWFIIIPLIARIHLWLQDRGIFVQVAANLELPFTWYLVYAASTVAFVANMIYALRCPSLISNYANPGDFSRKSGSILEIKSALRATLRAGEGEPAWARDFIQHIAERTTVNGTQIASLPTVADKLNYSVINPHSVPSAFIHATQAVQTQHKASLTVCAALYLIAFSLLLYVLGENVHSVITHFLQHRGQ